MTRLAVLGPQPRRGGVHGFEGFAFALPLGLLGLMSGRPFKPFNRAISSRCAITVRLRSETRPNNSTTSAFNSGAERPSMSGGGMPTRNQNPTDLGIPIIPARPDFCPCYGRGEAVRLPNGSSALPHGRKALPSGRICFRARRETLAL